MMVTCKPCGVAVSEFFCNDVKAVVDAARNEKAETVVKVIIETCYLTDEEKRTACELCEKSGVDFIKTSTGMGSGGATLHDVKLIRETVGNRLKVKASGGVDNRESAYAFLNAGADRLGVSRVPQIVNDDTSIQSAAATNQPPKFN